MGSSLVRYVVVPHLVLTRISFPRCRVRRGREIVPIAATPDAGTGEVVVVCADWLG